MNFNPIKLDAKLMDYTEGWAWRIQHENPKWDNFSLARVLATMSFLIDALPALSGGIIPFVTVLCAFAPQWIFMLVVVDMWESARLAQVSGRNIMRDQWGVRLGMIVMAISFIFPLQQTWVTDVVTWLLRIVIFYLLCCNGMPPGWKPPEKVPAAKMQPI